MSPTCATNNMRVKGDYYQIKVAPNLFSMEDLWIDTNIRATRYKHSDLKPTNSIFDGIIKLLKK